VARFWWLCDDAYISFRYARNWATGAGVRYNLGEHVPVEGYSNFLWVAAGALVEVLGGAQEVVLPWLSFALGSLALWLVFRLARRVFEVPLPCAALGTLTLAASPPFAVWSTGGLETMAFAVLFLLAFERLVVRPHAVLGAISGLGLAIVRVEGAAWLLALVVLGVLVQRLERERLRPVLLASAGALLGFALYFAWRYTYYGLPLPNTAYVKLGFGPAACALGWHYVAGFSLATLTPLAMPLVALGALFAVRRDARLTVGAIVVVATAVYAYAVVVGGDYMAMGRLLIPALPLQALLVAICLVQLGRAAIPTAALLTGLGLLCAFDIHPVREATRQRFDVRHNAEQFRSELEQWRYMESNTRERLELAQVLAANTKPGESLVRPAIGVLGYGTELFIYDTYGLVTRSVAAREGFAEDRSPGHAKRVEPTFFLDQSPTYLAVRRIEVEDSTDPKAAARRLRRGARHWMEVYGEDVAARYVPQAYPIEGAQGQAFVLLLRRLAPNEDAAQQWEELTSTGRAR